MPEAESHVAAPPLPPPGAENLCAQVLRNCDISDARFAGSFSICGLALRLRDLYKWEKGLAPWVEHPSKRVLAWIGTKEERWDSLAQAPFLDLKLNGSRKDPFDTDPINAHLMPAGLFYGAGYARALKPTFLLAEITTSRTLEGIPVLLLGREIARDMLTIPALTQGDTILVRQEAALQYLWDQLFFVPKSGRQPLAAALAGRGLSLDRPEEIQRQLPRLLRIQLPTLIRHELGEVRDGTLDRGTWRKIVSAFPHTPVELFARRLKDLLADTHPQGPLPSIIRQRRRAALSFYVAFLDSFAARIFPGLVPAYQRFQSDSQWPALETCLAEGRGRFKQLADRLQTLFRESEAGKRLDQTQGVIMQEIINPLIK
ncbi:MAG: Sfum_1244 family protein [Desulfobacterales bacterium]|jgi:hypothetical protein